MNSTLEKAHEEVRERLKRSKGRISGMCEGDPPAIVSGDCHWQSLTNDAARAHYLTEIEKWLDTAVKGYVELPTICEALQNIAHQHVHAALHASEGDPANDAWAKARARTWYLSVLNPHGRLDPAFKAIREAAVAAMRPAEQEG